MYIAIYQIQYSNNVIGEFDSSFLTYDCRKNPESEKREIAHMLRFYEEVVLKQNSAKYFGLLSPKFSNKAKISGKSFIDWIDANPGYDVYFINPFPQLSYWNFNIWTQGEFWHPGLKDLSTALLNSAGYNFDIEDLPRNNNKTALYSNFWVANKKFWDSYMEFIKKIIFAIDNLSDSDKAKIFEITPHYTSATFFPFIFERLFSTFLILEKNISYLSYKHEIDEIRDCCNNDMERFIINEWTEIIDSMDNTNKDNEQYKKLFTNLQRMLHIYELNQVSVDNPNPFNLKNIFNNLKNIIRR